MAFLTDQHCRAAARREPEAYESVRDKLRADLELRKYTALFTRRVLSYIPI